MMLAFLICQLCVVVFIALHDWLPLGRLNNLTGIRAVDTRLRRIVTTALSTLPFGIGLAGSVYYSGGRFPSWLFWLLAISYGLGLYGMLRAWYLPYLVYHDSARARRYQERFANTHALLPMRHGIRPDTLHVSFHVVLVLTAALLFILAISGRLTAA